VNIFSLNLNNLDAPVFLKVQPQTKLQKNLFKLNFKIQTLKYDPFFPDLYFTSFGFDSLDHRDFLKKKFLRTGLQEQDLEDMFNFKIDESSLYEDKSSDASNQIYYKGEFININVLRQILLIHLISSLLLRLVFDVNYN